MVSLEETMSSLNFSTRHIDVNDKWYNVIQDEERTVDGTSSSISHDTFDFQAWPEIELEISSEVYDNNDTSSELDMDNSDKDSLCRKILCDVLDDHTTTLTGKYQDEFNDNGTASTYRSTLSSYSSKMFQMMDPFDNSSHIWEKDDSIKAEKLQKNDVGALSNNFTVWTHLED